MKVTVNQITRDIRVESVSRSVIVRRPILNVQVNQVGRRGQPGIGVPTGGDTGQVLAKASGTDYDTEWVEQSGGGAGITIDGFDLTEDDRKLQYQPGIIETNNGEEHFSIKGNHLGGYTETEGYDLGGYIMGGYTAEGGYSLSQVDLRMRNITLTPRASGVIATEQWVGNNTIQGISAGDNITVDSSDPYNPIISAIGGGVTYEGFTEYNPDNGEGVSHTPSELIMTNAAGTEATLRPTGMTMMSDGNTFSADYSNIQGTDGTTGASYVLSSTGINYVDPSISGAGILAFPGDSGTLATREWVGTPVTSVNDRTGDVTGLAEQAYVDMIEEELFQDITTGLETKVNKSGDTMTGGLTINNGVGTIALDYLSPNEPALFMNGVFRLLYAAGYGMLFNVNGGDNLEIRIGNDPYNSLLFNNEKNLVVGFANGVPVTSDKLQVRGSGRFEGTVQGSNATASNHFVTKSQLDSSINTTTGFKYIGATEPDTTDWAVNDLWYDTSTEVS